VSSSHDATIKTWHTTPRRPDKPEPPKVLSVTTTTALITWTCPPCFNLEANAFFLQYRVGLRENWQPKKTKNKKHNINNSSKKSNNENNDHDDNDDGYDGISIAPDARSRVVKELMAATYYQFRIQVENRIGKSEWSDPSKLVYLKLLLLFLLLLSVFVLLNFCLNT
jgi:hypothetical protein